MNLKKTKTIVGVITLIVLSIILITSLFIGIIAENTSFYGGLSACIFSTSLFLIFLGLKRDEDENEVTENYIDFTVIIFISCIILTIFGSLIISNHLESSKSNYLANKGIIVIVKVLNTQHSYFISKGQKHHLYNTIIEFNNLSKDKKNPWLKITESEYHSLKEAKEVLLIYSKENIKIIDLIIEEEKYNFYNNNILENKSIVNHSLVQKWIKNKAYFNFK